MLLEGVEFSLKSSRGVARRIFEGDSKSSKIPDLFQSDFTYSNLYFLAGELFSLP